MESERAEVLEFLEWFYDNADFGPATGDVKAIMREMFQKETGKLPPDGYDGEE